MEYNYIGRVWLSNLKGANGEFAEKSDVMDNTLDQDVTELVKSSDIMSESLSEAIVSITNNFDGYESEEDYRRYVDIDEDYVDDESFGNEGYWYVEVTTNRKLTDEEIKTIKDWYRNDGDYFWPDMFEELELTLES